MPVLSERQDLELRIIYTPCVDPENMAWSIADWVEDEGSPWTASPPPCRIREPYQEFDHINEHYDTK